jgi:CheY-like chemotaxis protein
MPSMTREDGDDETATEGPGRLKILDIAPDRARRREFSKRIAEDGHTIVTVPGRREALKELKAGEFDLAVLDANSDLYDARELVAEINEKAAKKKEPIIAVVVEPRNRPPRHRIAGRAANVVFLQDGSVEHMTRVVSLAVSIREGDVDPNAIEDDIDLLPVEGDAAE